MNTCPICKTLRTQIKFAPISYVPDEKLAFVERVCGLLVQSRYGMDRVYVELVGPRPVHDDDQDAFVADVKSFAPPRVIRKLRRLLKQLKIAASLFINRLKKPGTHNSSPSTLGRGSPKNYSSTPLFPCSSVHSVVYLLRSIQRIFTTDHTEKHGTRFVRRTNRSLKIPLYLLGLVANGDAHYSLGCSRFGGTLG